MKKYFLQLSLIAFLAIGFSCKGKDKTTDTPIAPSTNTTPEVAPPPAPVQVSSDAALRQGVTDATKDIKGLQAEVKDSVIVLSGTISKQDNMRVTPTLNSLHPKKIDRTNLKVQ